MLRKALSADTLSTLLAEIDPIEDEIDGYVIGLDDGRTFSYAADAMTFANDLIHKSNVVRKFCRSLLFQQIGHDLLGPNVRLYWNQAVYKKPGKGKAFPWHQDNGYTFTEPQDYLTCWIALNDATLDNGCPWILPQLHRRGTLYHEHTDWGLVISGANDPEIETSAVATPLNAGDLVIFSALTPHKTGENTSDEIRKALILQFARDGTVRISQDGTRTPQTDPDRNMWILCNDKEPE